MRSAFEREITGFFGPDTVVDFPQQYRIAADWTPAGVNAAIDRLLADSGANLVVTLGPIGSDELARRRDLPKPAIAALIIDAALQQLPVHEGASGVRNLSYVDVAFTTSRTLEVFHEVVPYQRLAVFLHPGVLEAMPRLRDRARELGAALQVSVEFVPVRTSAAAALAAMPTGTDAVYLGGLETARGGSRLADPGVHRPPAAVILHPGRRRRRARRARFVRAARRPGPARSPGVRDHPAHPQRRGRRHPPRGAHRDPAAHAQHGDRARDRILPVVGHDDRSAADTRGGAGHGAVVVARAGG